MIVVSDLVAEMEAAGAPKHACRVCVAPKEIKDALWLVRDKGTSNYAAMRKVLFKHGIQASEKTIKRHLTECPRG